MTFSSSAHFTLLAPDHPSPRTLRASMSSRHSNLSRPRYQPPAIFFELEKEFLQQGKKRNGMHDRQSLGPAGRGYILVLAKSNWRSAGRPKATELNRHQKGVARPARTSGQLSRSRSQVDELASDSDEALPESPSHSIKADKARSGRKRQPASKSPNGFASDRFSTLPDEVRQNVRHCFGYSIQVARTA